MIDYNIAEEWFSKLPEHRKLNIQRQWLDYNKYFDCNEYKGNWYNEDNEYDIISSLYSHSDWLTEEEWNDYQNLENNY